MSAEAITVSEANPTDSVTEADSWAGEDGTGLQVTTSICGLGGKAISGSIGRPGEGKGSTIAVALDGKWGNSGQDGADGVTAGQNWSCWNGSDCADESEEDDLQIEKVGFI